jgi:hypothetical protein
MDVDENQCKFCNKIFLNKGNLLKHQKTAKYCIEIQNKSQITQKTIVNFCCTFCNKQFTSNSYLTIHIDKFCIEKYKQNIQQLIEENKDHKEKIAEKDRRIYELETENKLLKQSPQAEIEQRNEVISSMVKKYIKKQPRKKFDCSNVVYILTTTSLKKDRRYILGKAKNLTNKLSTYNKTDEHEVIYYQDCENGKNMSALESLVFTKLDDYREQANRERFILPENNDINLFIDTIKSCFEFLK